MSMYGYRFQRVWAGYLSPSLSPHVHEQGVQSCVIYTNGSSSDQQEDDIFNSTVPYMINNWQILDDAKVWWFLIEIWRVTLLLRIDLKNY